MNKNVPIAAHTPREPASDLIPDTRFGTFDYDGETGLHGQLVDATTSKDAQCVKIIQKKLYDAHLMHRTRRLNRAVVRDNL